MRKQPRLEMLRLLCGILVLAVSSIAMPLYGDDSVSGTNRPPVQIFYIPIPEDGLLTALNVIANGRTDSYAPVDPVQTYISLAIFVTGTVIYYDQWENGYDRDIANPNNLYSASTPGGTQIWGDGDPSNGAAPGYPDDVLSAGNVILLSNAVNSKTRQGVIDWDGGDKIGTTKPIAVTRAGWATGSNTLLAGANEVYDTVFFGTEFRSPVGTDSPDSNQMFEYSGLMIMAGSDGTTVHVDTDGNGTFDETFSIGEGETAFVNGGVKKGGRVVSDKPVQVDLLTGDIGSNFESRFFRLLPTSTWTDALTTPVATATSYDRTSCGTRVWLYNPNSSPITVRRISRTSANATVLSTNLLTVAANGNTDVTLTEGCGARFESTGGEHFYALSTTDSTSTESNGSGNQSWDWGAALVPDDALTAQVFVGLGIGRDPTSSVNPLENGSPVWVTPIGNGNEKARIYVDYDSDPTTGSAHGVDANGNKYDAYYDLRELVSQKIFNPDGDQTGILIYTVDEGVKLAAAWGSDPKTTSTGAPGLDFGTGIPPMPAFFMQKTSSLKTDNDNDGYITPNDVIRYDILIENIGRQPVTDIKVRDILPGSVSYIAGSTLFTDETGAVSAIPDLDGAVRFPLGTADGYLFDDYLPVSGAWHVTYDTSVNAFNAGSGVESIQNKATVSSGTTSYTNSVTDALRGRIGDFVWLDANMNGIQDTGEEGLNGVAVRLLNEDGTAALNDRDTPYTCTTQTDSENRAGAYLFTGVRPGRYFVEFALPEGCAFTERNSGDSAALDSDAGTDANPAATEVFRLDGGQFKLDIDAGLIQLGSISGSVLIDKNGDGINDPEDADPIFGVTLTLLNSAGEVVATTTTQADGSYTFKSLRPGAYTVRKTNADGWISSFDTFGDNDNEIAVNVAFGASCTGNDFHDTMPVSIGDKVWLDTDRDGIQDAGEPGLANVSVQLLDASGTLLDSTVTDENGAYLFENKKPGTYRVTVIPPAGYVFTVQDAGSDDTMDSDAQTDGTVAAVTLSYGTAALNIDAGLFLPASRVNIVVTAGTAADGAVWTVNGSADVVYTYTVKNTGETYLSDIVVTDDKLGAIGTVAGPLAPNTTATLTATAVAVSAGVTNIATATANPTDGAGTDLNGLDDVTDSDDAQVVVIPYASIGDSAWVDLDGDGLQDAGEPGLGGVTVTLYKNGSAIASATTDAGGAYLFDHLLEGSYAVGFSMPYGYTATVANAGDDARDSDRLPATGRTAVFTLTGGTHRTDIDAGYARLSASVQVVKTAGSAADGDVLTFYGTNDVVYTYVIKNTGATYLSDIAVTDDKLGAIGTVTGPLAPDAAATLTATAIAVSTNVINVATVTATPSDAGGTSLTGFETVSDTDDAKVVMVPYAFIGDFVWNDLNENGIQDADEPGLADFAVALYKDGVEIASAVTDANGRYGFNNLQEGDYSLTFTPPSSYQATISDATGDAADSDIDAGGVIGSFHLNAGVIDRTRDAGFVRPDAGITIVTTAGNAADGATLTITGSVDVVYTYIVENTGETYLSNIVVTDDKLGAIGTVAGPLAPNATATLTATAAAVSADVVNTATATANPTDAAGTDLDGLDDVTDSDDAKVVVVPYASVGDFVWNDLNRNGVQDADEPGLSEVTVTLYKDGNVIATTTTDANGAYRFGHLLEGSYQLGFTPPSGYRATAADAGADAEDSDLNPADGRTAEFVLGAGIEDDTRDAGFILLNASVEIVKTANGAADGTVLSVEGTTDIVYTYVVRNTGETYLANIAVTDDKLGDIGAVAGPLATNAAVTLTATAAGVSASVTNIATVTATPTDSGGTALEALNAVSDTDDAVVEVVPATPAADPTICELLDFGKTFNAVVFGNLVVSGGDTEGNLLVWGNATLPAGYSVGLAEYGETMPVAGARDDALIVGGDLYLGPQSVNGNVVYGGAYSGYDRTWQPYSVRRVSPVTLDQNGNVPEDHSGMTRDEMLAEIDRLSARLAAWNEQGVVSKETAENGDLTLVGTNSTHNVFNIMAWQWNGTGTARTLDVPAESTVIINIQGWDIAITNGTMILPAGMTPNQVLIHYTTAGSIAVSGFDHEGAVLAPCADASFSGAAVQGVAIFGGDVTTANGAEFHNFSLGVFNCPVSPSIRIVTTANDASDGDILQLTAATNVVVRQTVINTGSSWLRSVQLTAADGSTVTLGDLAPGIISVVETPFANVATDIIYTASVTAVPSTASGSAISGYAAVTDSDIAEVAYDDGTDDPVTDTTGSGTGALSKPDLHVSDIWFNIEPTITGEVFSVSVKVENTGDATSTGSGINLYLAGLEHPLNSADAGETPAASTALGTFIAGEVKVFTFKGLVAQSVAGQYRVIALVDPANEIEEYSEGDNHGSLVYALNAVAVSISVGTDGVTLMWNNYWGQIYSVMYSNDLEEWHVCPGFENISSARDSNGSVTNTATIPFSSEMRFFKLRIDQQ